MVARRKKPPPLVIGGLSLEQYAGITAGLEEGFVLAEILDQERIDGAAWPIAARGWAEAIVNSADLQIQLVQKRRIAEDCLGCTVSPLDDDPVAWAGLLGALATHEDPGSITDALGITMGDVSRLGRRWRQKTEADPQLAKHLEEVAPGAKPPARVEVGVRALRPFPWTPAALLPMNEAPYLATPVAPPSPDHVPIPEAPRRELASFQLRAQEAASPPRVQLPPAQAPPAQAPPAQPLLAPPQAVSRTMPGGPVVVDAHAATPFEAVEPATHGVSLLRYAQLVTLLTEPGADETAVLAAWGLDREKHHAIEEYYKAKFATEAHSAIEFGRMVVHAQAELAERRAQNPPPVLGGQ